MGWDSDDRRGARHDVDESTRDEPDLRAERDERVPGKRTRVDATLHRRAVPEDLPPGRRTRVEASYPDLASRPAWRRFVDDPRLLASAPPAVRATLANVFRVDVAALLRQAAAERAVEELAPRVGLAASSVRVEIGDQARQRVASGARGLADDGVVYLHPDRVDPGSVAGRRVLAHELTHVAQARRSGETDVDVDVARAELEADDAAAAVIAGAAVEVHAPLVGAAADTGADGAIDRILARPIAVTITAQPSGLRCEPRRGATFAAGVDRWLQAAAAVLAALVGARYHRALVDDAHRQLGFHPLGGLRGVARAGEPVAAFTIEPLVARELVSWLDARALPAALTDAQREIVLGAADVVEVWPHVAAERALPPWYSERIFSAVAFLHAPLLREVRRIGPRAAAPGLLAVIAPPAAVLDAIRADADLVDVPGYRGLWELPARTPGAPPDPPVGAQTTPHAGLAARFLIELHSQEDLAARALTSHDARALLLRHFAGRLADDPRVQLSGDAELRDAPSRANTPALPSRLTAYPVLAPPHFEQARGAETAFAMALEYPDALEALGRTHYRWEVLRVASLETAADAADSAAGERPGWGDVAAARGDRVSRHHAADVERIYGDVAAQLGPHGIGVVDIAGVNAAMGHAGALVTTFIQAVALPRSEKIIPFPSDGVYIVRCIATPRPGPDAAIVRAPSVAWLPVQVRGAEPLSQLGVQRQLAARAGAYARMREIEHALADGDLPSAARAAHERELAAITTELSGSAGDVLRAEQLQLRALERQLAGQRSPEAAAAGVQIAARLDAIDEILALRQARLGGAGRAGLEPPVRVPATFVADSGQVMHLLLEAAQEEASAAEVVYRVVDSTTADSGHTTARAPSRDAAIVSALHTLLEGVTTGYGRGHCSIAIPPAAGAAGPPLLRSIRVEASLAAIALEAVDNATRLLSIASLAAAPFTGGASLLLMVPVGVVGAIPSAYRLLERGSQGTLRVDLATAMDIVNLVASVAGLGQMTVGLRFIRLQGAFLIAGLGADGLGMCLVPVGLLQQLTHLDPSLPPGLRCAMIMEIVGQQLLDLGLTVGHSLAARALHERAAHVGADVDGAPPPDAAEPAVGAVRGRDVYEARPSGNLGAGSLQSNIKPLLGADLACSAKLAAAAADPDALRYTLTVLQRTGGAVAVDIRVLASSELPASDAHGDAAGPARFTLRRPDAAAPGAPWTAEIVVDRRVRDRDLRFIVGHELDEIAFIVHDDTAAADIPGQTQSRLYRADAAPGDTAITSHDRASARELAALLEDVEASMGARDVPVGDAFLRRLTDPHKISPDVATKLARIDRMMAEMGLYQPERRADKLRLLGEAGGLSPPVLAALEQHVTVRGIFRDHHGGPTTKPGSFVTESLIRHLQYPAAVSPGAFKNSGLNGGHEDAQLQSFVVSDSRFQLQLIKRKGDYAAYSQTMTDKGQVIAALAPKTTVKDLPRFLTDCDLAIANFFRQHPPQADLDNAPIGKGLGGDMIVLPDGAEIGGFIDYDVATGLATVRTVFPDAGWVSI